MLSYFLDYEEAVFRDGTRASKEEFLNGMLYYHGTIYNQNGNEAATDFSYNGDKYMYFLMSNSALKVESYVANEVELVPGSREWEDFTKLTLYMSLYTSQYEQEGNEVSYIQISNLRADEETGMYSLNYEISGRESNQYPGERSIDTASYEIGTITTPWEPGYLERSLEQFILGTYSEDVTLLGTVGEILFGFTPFDIVQDFRDMTYYIKRIRCGDISFENIMMTAVSFLCIFGIGELFANSKYLKYLDDVNVDVSDVRNLAKVTEATEECLENSPKTISNILEQAEVAKYTDDVEDMGSVIVMSNKGDDVVTTTVKKTDTVEDSISDVGKVSESGSKGGAPTLENISEPVAAGPSLVQPGEGYNLKEAATKINPIEGYTDVVLHGTPDSFGVWHNGKWEYIDQRSLANFLKHNPEYNGGPVRLISCSTGAKSDGIAQQLANKLGVDVMAPSDTLYIYPNGSTVIGPNPYTNTGSWENFKPGKW